MHRSALPIVLAGTLVLGVGLATAGSEPATAFERIGEHYESIRQSLLHDTTDGVAVAAGQILDELEALGSDPQVTSGELLPAMRAALGRLQAAGDLEQARSAFGALSKALAQHRRMVADPEPVVVFCSMAGAVWLQPKGEIGNPYYGQSMARCGEVVSE